MSKLGTKLKPAIARVRNEVRAVQILELCDNRGWKVMVGIEPGKEEDLSDIVRLLNPPKPVVSAKVERNAPCTCGSGLKAKKCCYK